jgi:hypothetical protein
MQILLAAIVGLFKKLFLKMATEKFLVWLFLWAGKMLVESTKTTKDDEFFKQVEKLLNE